ncbi:MAG: hypothetical protein EOM65_04945 [Synergistales bacterium]|nr:hypothetical protein [Synergistales bacterium]
MATRRTGPLRLSEDICGADGRAIFRKGDIVSVTSFGISGSWMEEARVTRMSDFLSALVDISMVRTDGNPL